MLLFDTFVLTIYNEFKTDIYIFAYIVHLMTHLLIIINGFKKFIVFDNHVELLMYSGIIFAMNAF